MPNWRRPGDTTRRGYGTEHQRLRAEWSATVAAGGVDCARCHRRIESGQRWDLGHADGSGKRFYTGPEHASCNRAAGASAMQATDPLPVSRQWWRKTASEQRSDDEQGDGSHGA